jgi:hypothetical protein
MFVRLEFRNAYVCTVATEAGIVTVTTLELYPKA